MSAVASIIFESHLHCTKDNLPCLFFYSLCVGYGQTLVLVDLKLGREGRYPAQKRKSVLVVWGEGDMV